VIYNYEPEKGNPKSLGGGGKIKWWG